MTSPSVALILGAGPRVGASVADRFVADGYKVALASRKGTGSKDGGNRLSLKADFTNPESIPKVFDAVKTEFGVFPNVVIYNAAAMTPPSVQDSLFSIPSEKVALDLNVNTVSPYVAAQQAVKGWETLPAEVKKTFIYTGNALNVTIVPVPIMFNLGMGKSASASWIGTADALYAAKGYRFFYADERHPDGKIKGMELDGPAHADFYADLVKQESLTPWAATFVKGKGYVSFKYSLLPSILDI